MTERHLRRLIDSVREGKVARRDFIATLLRLGIAAPLASQLLRHAGVAQTPTAAAYPATKRGGGGALKLLWWQGPTSLNPHFALGSKDVDGARIFYEPLASWDREGNPVPILAAEIPSLENGGVSRDGRSVIWKLKKDVQWHDGKPFTSADVVFNWKYATDPATASSNLGVYENMQVDAVDALTVRITFAQVRAFWASPFVGTGGMIIPKHLFESYLGANSREAPHNLKPVGTGPYRFAAFTPGDMLRGTLNANYHQPNRPFFDTIELKGGGDAVSAARAVLQTGEFDFAENLQVEDEVLARMEKVGKGRVDLVAAGSVESIWINFTDPWTEVDGERSSIKTKHPVLSDRVVRQALNLLIDRTSIEKFIYGRTGTATANFVNNPERYRSKNNRFEFNVERAGQLLEQAGWKMGADGVRARGGRKLKLVFHTSVNQPRQKTQAIIKQACKRAGIDLELKAITPSVYFASDFGNPDTNDKFFCDIQMYTLNVSPDPENALRSFCSWEVACKANKWQGRNVTRWRNEEFDQSYRAAETEVDPVKRTALLIRMNDLVVQDHALLPIIARPSVTAASVKLRQQGTNWDSTLAFLSDWHRVR